MVSILKKHNIPYVVSGGFAAHIYGSKRFINDIDFDIPEYSMELLIPDIKEFVVFWPAQYKNKAWNLKLITLNYKGQEIDIGGAYETKVFDNQYEVWRNFPVKFDNANIQNVHVLRVSVINPIELIRYKNFLIEDNFPSDHQREDIKAFYKYIKNNF